jgi:drug/metabolite transporter (DMT)-like permease
MSKNLQAHLALIIVSLVYAATFSVAKQVMPAYVPPQAFVIVRSGSAMVLFWLVGFFFIKEKVDKKDFPRLALLGACGVAINQSLFLLGLSLTSPINASIIMVSNPVFVLLIAAILLKEKISFNKIIGIGFGIVGALLLLLFNKNFSFGSDTIFGDFLVLVNSMSWACYIVLVKPLMQKYNAFTIVKWTFLFGFIYVFPFGLHDFRQINWAAMPSVAWMNIAFVVLGSTFLAYVLNTYALRALSPSAVSIYIYFQPFLTTLIAVYYYHNDALDTRKIVSGILIVIGVALVSKPTKSLEKV